MIEDVKVRQVGTHQHKIKKEEEVDFVNIFIIVIINFLLKKNKIYF